MPPVAVHLEHTSLWMQLLHRFSILALHELDKIGIVHLFLAKVCAVLVAIFAPYMSTISRKPDAVTAFFTVRLVHGLPSFPNPTACGLSLEISLPSFQARS